MNQKAINSPAVLTRHITPEPGNSIAVDEVEIPETLGDQNNIHARAAAREPLMLRVPMTVIILRLAMPAAASCSSMPLPVPPASVSSVPKNSQLGLPRVPPAK
ncbi:hypothetical protein BJX66DRAFT_318073 [Aspergillus keveii]|uniref:Uncharacterized protein n=1 Tax=Aspergillus keveii TaxID=714993 RepID=A0ABR4FKX0_9EURO